MNQHISNTLDFPPGNVWIMLLNFCWNNAGSFTDGCKFEGYSA